MEALKQPNHPDWITELEHLQYTLKLVSNALDESVKTKKNIDGEVQRLKETGDPDSSIDYVDLSVNLLIQGSLELRLRNLKEAETKPYFARIDFQENGSTHTEPVYIGKMVLIREEDMKPVIIDWRAPIASLYYEERLGDAHYIAPRGDIQGQMTLKRQYTIENGNLKNLFDIDITTNDTFLQSYLGASADNRLKDIVSTIQAEQNRIIRADMWTPLIVQGAAGSGKTTIALHRIAYLVYTHEKTFNPENFMIIAPNTLFLNYISEILPELGVDQVRQTTFEDFAMDLIGKRFKVRDPNEKLMILAENKDPDWANRLADASRLKASTRYKNLLDTFMDLMEQKMLPNHDFEVIGEVLISRHELNQLFTEEYRRWPVKNRLEEVKKHMVTAAKRRRNALANKVEQNCLRKITAIKEKYEQIMEQENIKLLRMEEIVQESPAKDIQTSKTSYTKISDLAKEMIEKPLAMGRDDGILASKSAEYKQKTPEPGIHIQMSHRSEFRTHKPDNFQNITQKGQGRVNNTISSAEIDMRLQIIAAYNERDEQLNHLQKDISKSITEYLSGIMKPSTHDWYVQFIDWFGKNASNETEDFAAKWSDKVLKEKKIELEDLAALIHLRYRIHGLNEKIPVRHIVIDEAQDFSAFQFDVVRRIIPDSSFTILGDLCQGIHSYRSLSSWEEIQNQVFQDRKTKILTLEQSYRTTVEIMDAANLVASHMEIPGVPAAKPVIRHGEPVILQVHSSAMEYRILCNAIGNRIIELEKRGMKLLAVIGKTLDECKTLYSYLRSSVPKIQLITGVEDEYGGGILVVPAHLSKGLEFDAVIIADASASRYTESLIDSKLLYVATTRAMHILDIHCLGEPTALLTGLSQNLN